MIKAVTRSISIIGCIAVFSGTLFAEPFSVIDSFRVRIKALASMSASIERVQVYRGVRRASTGALQFDLHYGSVYNWSQPGKYRFFRSVYGACGVDMNKQTGWRTTVGTPDLAVAREIDPLYRFLHIADIPAAKIAYRGNKGDMLVFSTSLGVGKQLCFSFDASSCRCLVAEMIDDDGVVSEKTKFIYNEKRKGQIVPDAMVITSVVGHEVAVDSLVFTRETFNRKIDKEIFAIPREISWNDEVRLALPY